MHADQQQMYNWTMLNVNIFCLHPVIYLHKQEEKSQVGGDDDGQEQVEHGRFNAAKHTQTTLPKSMLSNQNMQLSIDNKLSAKTRWTCRRTDVDTQRM